jgi:hypothetical protein
VGKRDPAAVPRLLRIVGKRGGADDLQSERSRLLTDLGSVAIPGREDQEALSGRQSGARLQQAARRGVQALLMRVGLPVAAGGGVGRKR